MKNIIERARTLWLILSIKANRRRRARASQPDEATPDPATPEAPPPWWRRLAAGLIQRERLGLAVATALFSLLLFPPDSSPWRSGLKTPELSPVSLWRTASKAEWRLVSHFGRSTHVMAFTLDPQGKLWLLLPHQARRSTLIQAGRRLLTTLSLGQAHEQGRLFVVYSSHSFQATAFREAFAKAWKRADRKLHRLGTIPGPWEIERFSLAKGSLRF